MLVMVPAASAKDSTGDEFFEAKVRPILVARCFECHGDKGKPKGGLRLDSRAAVLKGGDSGPAALPGKPEDSALVAAIRYVDEPRMPPKARLADAEVAILTQWVERGLPWPAKASAPMAGLAKAPWRITDDQRKHWAYQPLSDPPVPRVRDTSWPRSDIDRFILAGLERKGIAPAPPADRRTLIRRATFDLTGLPPTPEEVEEFVSDPSPNAFAAVVDRLLASPRYGERWGRHWLDLVRYADSRDARGVGSPDDITEAYRYRDWVVSAFNRDLPYDRFITDQIAGDLIPGPNGFNGEGMVATGLLTIGEWGTGDADKEKMMTDIVADQVDVVTRAFMGLTVACARCHDHKFDPISHADYYGLAGIFFSTHILPEPGAKTAGSPMLKTPIVPKSVIDASERHKGRLAALEAEQKAATATEARTFARSQIGRTADYLGAAAEVVSTTDGAVSTDAIARGRGLDPATLRRWLAYLGLVDEGTLLTRPVASMSGVKGVDFWAGPKDPPWIGVNRNDRPISILTFTLPPKSVVLHPGPDEPAAVVWTSPIGGKVAVEGHVADSDGACGDGAAWSLDRRKGQSWTSLASGSYFNGGKSDVKAAGIELSPGDALRLVVLPKAEYSCDTTTIRFRIIPDGDRPAWDLTADVVPDLLLGDKGNPHPDRSGQPGVWRFVKLAPVRALRRDDPDSPLSGWLRAVDARDTKAADAAGFMVQEALGRAKGKPLADAITGPGGPYDPAPADLPLLARLRLAKRQAEIEALRASIPPPIPVGLVAREGGVPKSAYEGIKDTRIQIRGEYSRLGPVVPRRFPVILAGDAQPPLPDRSSGRLELARWIARPDHPMTARVMANRIWAFHFGEGIVRTPSNFGKLGEPPSDPALLDALARRFIASGWSVKAIHRLLMNSAVYQQSVTACPETVKADPENRLFSRMNRHRLESEAIRDGLLAVSGRLDLTPGGPSFRDIAIPRRTLYLMTIRSDRSSFGPLFDAADATAMVDTRVVSTVAPQALFLLNSPFALEAARAFADRVRRESSGTEARIARAYRLAYGRPPTAEEIEVGRGLVGNGDDPVAWTGYLHVILCGNEFVFVD